MRERAVSRLQLETDLRNAIDNERADGAYQPIISLATSTIEGFEALARWHHPTTRRDQPGRFIPIAEDIGMIRQVGRLVLAASCRQMAEWQRQFGRSRAAHRVRQRRCGPVRSARSRRGGRDASSTRPASAVEVEAGNHRKHVHQATSPRRGHARTACSRSASNGASTISARAIRRSAICIVCRRTR